MQLKFYKNLYLAPLLLLLLCGLDASAQMFRSSSYWKQYRQEVYGGVGPTNFLGELGGKDRIGTDFLNDLDLEATRMSIHAGYRYYLMRNVSFRGELGYNVISGDDANTTQLQRMNRNLHFKNNLIETAGIFELHLTQERSSHRYKLRGAKGASAFVVGLYVYTGISGFYHNPKAYHTNSNQWVALRPLGTEGQLLNGAGEYSKFAVAIPYGAGLRYAINTKWRISLDLSGRKTFSDYLDDVSTTYYDNDELRAWNPVAADMADPNLQLLEQAYASGLDPTGHGQQRGDPNDKDTYLMATLNLNYKIIKRRGFKRIKSRRSVPSF